LEFYVLTPKTALSSLVRTLLVKREGIQVLRNGKDDLDRFAISNDGEMADWMKT
jgi:hypothetical protein